ncbi:MAG: hypothetical protein OYH77_06345 [Pseudomonadota bacterium]|nr:hypothetical protein [Pseudomonadota bacterium]
MKAMHNFIIIAMLITCVLACKQAMTEEEYNALLKKEEIEQAEYEKMIIDINNCIRTSQHGEQPLAEDQITRDMLSNSSRVYCSDYSTTLEHKFVRFCRYYVYHQKNSNNIKSCYCEIVKKRQDIRNELQANCDELFKDKYAERLNSTIIKAYLGDTLKTECESLQNTSTTEHLYGCD